MNLYKQNKKWWGGDQTNWLEPGAVNQDTVTRKYGGGGTNGR